MNTYIVKWHNDKNRIPRFYNVPAINAQAAADGLRRLFSEGYAHVLAVALVQTDWE